MQRILQINIAGRAVPIEEDAYIILKDYISALQRQFTGEDGKEIIEDIEGRIAELFFIRLDGGSPAIDRADVQKVKDTLGAPNDLGDNTNTGKSSYQSNSNTYSSYTRTNYRQNQYSPKHDRLLRDPYDKVIGGVCSGVARYFGIDPVIIRLIMVVLFLSFGIGFVAYIIAWAIVPAATSREELYTGIPMSIHDISKNMAVELEDLKRRGEQMSRELKDFFSKKK
jgi:phage shock protein PspC (stress-responsive transcriptional regulator)